MAHRHREHRTVDLKKDKKYAAAVQGLFVLMALVAVGSALLLELPLETSWNPVLTTAVTLFASLTYMAVHEATHGVVLQTLTKVKPSYAVRFPFLTTGNHAYLTRRSAVVVQQPDALVQDDGDKVHVFMPHD